ncbi:MAG: hypothetical protein NC910_03075 [Candidatus Omnitrophica bacterium]|nr:hypothetical protein [Candidatus Omnitrophota bacterium]
MIRVNLLPPHARKKSRVSLQFVFPWKKTGACFFALIAVYSAWIFLSSRFYNVRLHRLRTQWTEMKPQRTEVENLEASLRAFQNRAELTKTLKNPKSQWAPRLNILSDAIVARLWFTSLDYRPISSVDGGTAGSAKKKVKVRKKEAKNETAPQKEETKKEENKTGNAPREKKSRRGSKKEKQVAPPPGVVLKGSAFVGGQGEGTSVNRYLQRLKQHPNFSEYFMGVKLENIQHKQLQKEEVSDFVIILYPRK